MPGPHAETSEPGAADPDTQLTHPDAEMPYRLTEMLDPHAEMSEPGAADPDTQVTDADTEMPDRLTEMLDPHAEMSEPGAADPDMPLTDPDTEMPGPHAETSEPGTADPDIQLTDPHSERAAGTTEIVPVEIAESEIVPPSVSGDSEVIPIYALPCLTEKTAPMSVVEKVNHWTVSDSGAVTIDDPNPGSSTSGNCNILIYTKDANTKGKNRKLPCFYCGIFVYQMNRHLLRKHGNEPQVAAASANSIGRTLRLQKIVNQGLYKHNVEVLRNRDGVLIVGRSPKAKHTCDDFLPCEFCLHFFIKRELYRHSIRCKFRQADGPTTGFIRSGRSLLEGALEDTTSHIDKSLMDTVISKMRSDKLTAVVKGDTLILKFGLMLLRKLGRKRAADISARMRELARLLMRLQSDKNEKERTLSSFLSGASFDKVMGAIEQEGKPSTEVGGRKIFEKPAFVTRVGTSLLKCANLKRGTTLRDGDSADQKKAEDFISLFNSEFTDGMASIAHASYRIRGNSLSEFPEESDLRQLKDYQHRRIAALTETVSTNPCIFDWRELAEVTLSRLLVFNARRGSEAADLTLDDFSHCISSVDPALAATLTTVEQQLLQRLTVVNVIGKRNRPVPVLMTEDMHKAVSALIDAREKCGVLSINQYIFAIPHSKHSRLDFFGTLRRVAHRAGLKKPHLLTTTRMRKHLATMAQV